MNWDSANFDWNYTRAFLVTAEEGTLSAAAKALGLTQPTLSRQVAALEAELGITLFERVGQRLVLTDSGVQLLEPARLMGEAASQLSLAATGQSQQIEGSITISAAESDAVFRLPKIIAKLRRQEPGIDIEVIVTNEASDLKRRDADIAIRSFRPTQHDLIAKTIGEEVIWLCGTRDYIEQLPTFTSVSELTDVQIIGFDRSNMVADVLGQQGWQLSEKNFQLVTAFQPMQFELCKEGMGLMFLPEYVIKKHASLVRAFEHMGPVMELSIWLVCHQELRTSLRVRRVFDFIAEEYGQTS
ncbi:MAG: LysR family transcriptional regulator [Halioglobus sp.]